MLFPRSQVRMVVNGSKIATLRKPSFRIKTGKDHKFINNFKYGAFATAFIDSAEVIDVDDIDDELANDLGYANRSEYLQNGWTDEYDERVLIRFHIVDVNCETVKKILGEE